MSQLRPGRDRAADPEKADSECECVPYCGKIISVASHRSFDPLDNLGDRRSWRRSGTFRLLDRNSREIPPRTTVVAGLFRTHLGR